MYNRETSSQHEIALGQQNLKLPYDERLTRATCLLQQMKQGNLEAFAQARAEFAFLTNDMSLKAQYNAMYAYCKWGFKKRPVHHQAESDSYATGEEWQALWDSTKRRAKQ